VTLLEFAEIGGAIVTAGGAVAVLQKAVRALRKLSRVADGILGDGTKEHPGVVAGQSELVTAIEALKTQATEDLAEIRADLAAVKDDVAAVKTQTGVIEDKLDDHVDTDSAKWREDGQKWGNELQARAEDNTRRIEALEQHAGTDDPVVGV
jgi:hypothetical protein